MVEMRRLGWGGESFMEEEIGEMMKGDKKGLRVVKIDDVRNMGWVKVGVGWVIESVKGVKEVKSEEGRVKKEGWGGEGKGN